jgi:PAS domain S-box-containing protein
MIKALTQFEQLTKKLNAIILCHLPFVFAGVFLALGMQEDPSNITDVAILYAMAAASIPPLLMLLMHKPTKQEEEEEGRTFQHKPIRLTLAFVLIFHAIILSSFPPSKNVESFRFFSFLELALLATYVFERTIIDKPKGIPFIDRILPISNVALLSIIAALKFIPLGESFTNEMFFGIINADIAIVSAYTTIQIFKKNFPEKNSRLHSIICYSMFQTSIIFFILPHPFSDIVVSILSLGTLFALSLDFILLNPKALFENGFSFLTKQRALKETIEKVSEDLKLQEQKTVRIEKQLSDALFLTSASLDSMPTQICIFDADGKIILLNKAWNHFHTHEMEISKNTSVGGNYLEFLESQPNTNGYNYRKILAGLRSVMASELNEFVSQYMPMTKVGPRWYLCRVTQFDSPLGVRYMIVQEDISELKKTEEQLLLKSVAIESANDGIVLTDPTLPDNPIVYVSQGFLKLTGYTQSEVMGRNCRFMQGPDTDKEVVTKIREAIKNEASFDGELVNYTKLGRRWYNRLKLAPVRSQEGKLIRYVGVQLDVTAAKKLEIERKKAFEKEMAARQEVERLYREAQNANTIKDDFLATLSHELRTPAGVIVGFTELIKYENMTPQEREEAMDALERNARALVTLIDDMLDMSRVITGKFRLNPKPVDLTAIVDSVISAEMLAAQAKNIRIVTEFEPGAGPIYGDTTRLQQIFWNLLSNAIKFTPRNGRVKVTLRSEGTRIVVRVSDTGVGIEAKFLPHVFERFRQQDSGMDRSYGGLGLGLSIVKHLVELHGGSVEAESPGLGRGSTFSVSLPALTSAG